MPSLCQVNCLTVLLLLLTSVHATLDLLTVLGNEKAWYPEENAVAHWTGGEFQFPCTVVMKDIISAKQYIKPNALTTRLQLWKDKVLAVFPRYKSGVPVTLAMAKLKKPSCTLEWIPFPCWSAQTEGNCDAIQNAVDVVVDFKHQAWVLDSGITNTIVNPRSVCPPKIIVIDLFTHKVLRIINLRSLTDSYSRLQYLVVDHSIAGQPFIYISDAATRSILVWDVIAENGWRVMLPPAVLNGPKDVLYLALTNNKDLSTSLYFTYLSSTHMFYINTYLLRNKAAIARIINVGRKPDKMIILGTDGGTKIFFRYEGESEVFDWDTTVCFKPTNFNMVYKGQICRLATHVIPDYKKKMMMVLESNFPDFIKGTVGCGTSHTITPMVGCVKKVKKCSL